MVPVLLVKLSRAQEVCESRGGRPGLSVPNSPHGLFGRKTKLNLNRLNQSWLESHSENIRAQRYGVTLVIGGRRFDSPLRLSFLFKGFGLWALSRDVAPQQLMKHQTALVALHLKAEMILVMGV